MDLSINLKKFFIETKKTKHMKITLIKRQFNFWE